MAKEYDEYTVRAQEVKALADQSAARLFDGGWRSDDYEELMAEYDMDKDKAAGICAALATYED